MSAEPKRRHLVVAEFGKGSGGELLHSKFEEVCRKLGKSLSEAVRDVAMDYVAVYGDLTWDEAAEINVTDRLLRGPRDSQKLVSDAEKMRGKIEAQALEVFKNRRRSTVKT